MDGMTGDRTRTDLTRVLAARAGALRYDDLPAPVRELARQCVLDYLGVAIAGAQDPAAMAEAMKLAVRAGRLAFLSGRIPRKRYANASSPVEGLVGR